ncbi:MAG: ParB/RepB/Spo0J family partition protein [Candidatus Bathyarchaeia archaeon]
MEHVKESSRVEDLEIERLTLTPLTVRVNVGDLEPLAESFKLSGVLEPLLVRPSKSEPGKFEVVCGMRRFLAAQRVGLRAVPCIVKDMDDREAMEATLTENLQRENLTDFEVGRWFKLLMEKFPGEYPSQQALANKFKVTQRMVSYLVSHYEFIEQIKGRLPPNIRTRVLMLPEAMIREVKRAPEQIQDKLVHAIVRTFEKFERGEHPYPPSVRDIAAMVDSYVQSWKRRAEPPAEKLEGEKCAETPEKPPEPEAAESKVPVKPEPVKPQKEIASAPMTLPPPVPPLSEREVEATLEETIIKRREARLKREEEAVVALYKYYPESFIKDLESFCGAGTPIESIQKLAYYTVEVAWDRLSDAEKLDIIREARSWMD